jgi:hypothetical protein
MGVGYATPDAFVSRFQISISLRQMGFQLCSFGGRLSLLHLLYIYIDNGVAFFGFLSNLLEYGFSVLLPDMNRRRQTSLCVTSVAGNVCIYFYIPLLGPS